MTTIESKTDQWHGSMRVTHQLDLGKIAICLAEMYGPDYTPEYDDDGNPIYAEAELVAELPESRAGVLREVREHLKMWGDYGGNLDNGRWCINLCKAHVAKLWDVPNV